MFETFIKLILHIKEMMCYFVLDGSPRSDACVWKNSPDLADHIENVALHRDNATCHTTRNTLLEIDVLGFKRAIHQPYSTNLAPLDFV